MNRNHLAWALTCFVGAAPSRAQSTSTVEPPDLVAAVDHVEELRDAREFAGGRRAAAEAWKLCSTLDREVVAADPVQDALGRLGRAAWDLGDLRIAHDAWHLVVTHREATRSDDDPGLWSAWQVLGAAKAELGDAQGAEQLFSKVLRLREAHLPHDHVDVQKARGNLALARVKLGDLAGAVTLQQQVHDQFERSLPNDHPDLQRARIHLAQTKASLGDLEGALPLQQKALDVTARTVPHDHPDLQDARQALAMTLMRLGKLERAFALQQQVHDVVSSALPAEHPVVRNARINLAGLLKALGDLEEALRHERAVLAIEERILPDDDAGLQTTRSNLAGTLQAIGDLRGAAALREKVLAVRERIYPDDHPSLQRARGNLAVSKFDLGDSIGAMALLETALAAFERSLPAHHRDLQGARLNLAAMKRSLGDFEGALVLAEEALAVFSETLPPDHPDLQSARKTVGLTKRELGDRHDALDLLKAALKGRAAVLRDGHPDLLRTRGLVADVMDELGDLEGARAIHEQVLAQFSATLPNDHPDLQWSRAAAAGNLRASGDVAGAAALLLDRAVASQQRVRSWALAPREIGALAREEARTLSMIGSLLPECDAPTRASLASAALLTDAQLRGAELRTARHRRSARLEDGPRVAQLEKRLRAAVRDIRSMWEAADGPEDAALQRAVDTKEDLEKQITRTAFAGDADRAELPATSDLAAVLPQHSVGLTILDYTHWTIDRQKPWIAEPEKRLAALVLDRLGGVSWHALGPASPVDRLIAGIRPAAGSDGRGRRPRAGGRRPQAEDSVHAALRELGSVLLDRVVASLPEDVETLVVSLADTLQLVPLDALLLDSGEPLGARFRVENVTSLADLLEPSTAVPGDEPHLVGCGGIDYGEDPAEPGAPRHYEPFADLPATRAEIDALGEAFTAAHPKGSVTLLTGVEAHRRALASTAPGATFLHLATHGYFAPESLRSTADSSLDRFEFRAQEDRVSGLSPLVLTGLALAGARGPADSRGQRRGIFTAEEIAQLDLSGCYLATLSACDTSLGVRRAGQGFASLRAALQSAGARFVLTSLWRVGDQETSALMADFYRRLWVDGQDPYAALWSARIAARDRGVRFRDWAGWVLTGR